MIKIYIGLFLVALTTLMLELTLIRVFDVIWYSNMSYMVVTLAMFSFGMAGVYMSLKPPSTDGSRGSRRLGIVTALFGIFALLIMPALNYLPYDFDQFYRQPAQGVFFFFLVYIALALPFLFSGMVFAQVFNTYPARINRLYFWDLAGAGIGCLVLIPLLPPIGPGGLLFLACGVAMAAAGLFFGTRKMAVAGVVLAVGLASVPFMRVGDYYNIREQVSKRFLKEHRIRGEIERTYWDPVSKVDIVTFPARKEINYDGGSQTSYIIPFDGDYAGLREHFDTAAMFHFTGEGVTVSHYLKRDQGPKVLIIGSAGGQETKAALTFGASAVDSVELVGYVVGLGKSAYAEYNGNIYNDPRVHYQQGEGRAYLRASQKRYDIIQMFSNHTSSAIAAGTGAMATTYLQTTDAYKEYFQHLNPDGILHINHHVYPRMIATAAQAWRELGRDNFRRHVIVAEAPGEIQDNLVTLLIKMSPWTMEEVEAARIHLSAHQVVVEDPFHPERSVLPDEFYSGDLAASTAERVPYRVTATTDNRPYFNFLRRSDQRLKEDLGNYLDFSTASLLNSQLREGFLPMDIVHLVITAAASLLFCVVFIFVPLYFSRVGRASWPNKSNTLLYFGCLGAGFIIFELVFIQLFMKLIGYPLYTYSTVVFVMLFAAGVGSLATKWLGIDLERRWYVPFLGILGTVGLQLLFYQAESDFVLTEPTAVRVLVSAAMLFPVGFFLGMPFPLGILAIQDEPAGAIPWAWAMNGLFTVVGGFLSVILSIYFGFMQAIIVAMAIYVMALWIMSRMRANRAIAA